MDIIDYCNGDHFIMYANVKSTLCRILMTNIISYIYAQLLKTNRQTKLKNIYLDYNASN